ncbi:MAG: magnesium transporter CorA family protein [Candidatus Pacearchaeota archaeon]|jgi:magnesium transporter
MIEYFKKIKDEERIKKIESFEEGCWVNVTNPSDEEIEFLVKEFSLSKSNLIDGLDIHENPRFEIDNKKTYIYLTTPTENISQEYDSSFLIIYGKNHFITFSKTSLEIFERILNEKSRFMSFLISKNLVKVLNLVSKLFEESIQKIRKEIRKNRNKLSQLKTKDIEDLINYEDKLNEYISVFEANISTYKRILRDKSLHFLKKDEQNLEDAIIDLNQTLNLCKQTLKSISNARTYYSTKLSNDLNKTVTALTIVTIFISIPTLIASIYGMNISLPFQDGKYTFVGLMLLILAIVGTLFLVLKKARLIK